MIRQMKGRNSRRDSIKSNRKAASPAISMVIITATTVVLVLVSSVFAYQTLEHQQAASEFETLQKSLLAFDDAARDIAWDRGGSRTVRFNTRYGNLRLISSSKTFKIISSLGLEKNVTTGTLKYSMPTGYFTLGNGYVPSYILGNESAAVSTITDSLGQTILSQDSGFATISFNYRIRVTQQKPSVYIESDNVNMNYVDIMVIRLNCDNLNIDSGDFDLVAKNVGTNTQILGPFPVPQTGDYVVSVSSDNLAASTSNIHLSLDQGQAMFNLIIADVRVYI